MNMDQGTGSEDSGSGRECRFRGGTSSKCLKLLLEQQPVASDLKNDFLHLKNDHGSGADR